MWWNNDTNCEKDTERYFLCSNAHSAFASNVRECIFVQCQCVGGRLDTHSDTHTHNRSCLGQAESASEWNSCQNNSMSLVKPLTVFFG